MTKAQWVKPSRLATEVKSQIQNLFGAGTWNCRFTWPNGHSAFLSRIVLR